MNVGGFVAFANTMCLGRCISFAEELVIWISNGCFLIVGHLSHHAQQISVDEFLLIS